jgi:hypothetical protein
MRLFLVVIVCLSFVTGSSFNPTYPGVTRTYRPLKALGKEALPSSPDAKKRLDRTAPTNTDWIEPCIFEIHGITYNVSTWARSHPGGLQVLQKFHGKNATQAFEAAGHSVQAKAMLSQFVMLSEHNTNNESIAAVDLEQPAAAISWRQKLFTKEDPNGLHKYLGLFCLGHFVFRFSQMLFGDWSCGLGSRMNKGPSAVAAMCLLPHAVLSISSLIFESVPRERVIGKPMIWQEFRLHNILFGLRSIITTWLAWASIVFQHREPWRQIAVTTSCGVTLVSMYLADVVSQKWCPAPLESTTATMPYWDGCSLETQKRFKTFYAFSQFQATATCMAIGNPAWTLSLLLPIQTASLFMTLVRKGLMTARGYHYWYSFTLALPYAVGLRSIWKMKNLHFPLFLSASWLLFSLRRRGVNKYLLWVPFAIGRIVFADDLILHYDRPW